MNYQDLPEGHVVRLNSPNIHAMLTGVVCAEQSRDGTITLTYEDGRTEARRTDKQLADMDLFQATSFVQGGRIAREALSGKE